MAYDSPKPMETLVYDTGQGVLVTLEIPLGVRIYYWNHRGSLSN